MQTGNALPWLTLLALGAVHGINPGMGWLFAAALGLQEGRARAVWRALPALAIGHALAIALVLVVAALAGVVVPVEALRWIVAVTLLLTGVSKLLRQRHPRYGGMRVSSRQLAVWSFLMASAHGAGLMVMPVMLPPGPESADAVGIDFGIAETAAEGANGTAGGATHGDPVLAGHAHDATSIKVRTPDVHAHLRSQPAGAPGSGGHEAHMAGILTDVSHAHAAGAAATAVHTAGYLFVTGFLAWLVFAKLGVRILRSAWINLDLLWAIALIATAIATPFLA